MKIGIIRDENTLRLGMFVSGRCGTCDLLCEQIIFSLKFRNIRLVPYILRLKCFGDEKLRMAKLETRKQPTLIDRRSLVDRYGASL